MYFIIDRHHDSCICAALICVTDLRNYLGLLADESSNPFVTRQSINQKNNLIETGHDLRSPQFTIESIDVNICSAVTQENTRLFLLLPNFSRVFSYSLSCSCKKCITLRNIEISIEKNFIEERDCRKVYLMMDKMACST